MSRFRGKNTSFTNASMTSDVVLSSFFNNLEDRYARDLKQAERKEEAMKKRAEIMRSITEVLKDAFSKTKACTIIDEVSSEWARVGYNREPVSALVSLNERLKHLPDISNVWHATLKKVCKDFNLEIKTFGLEDEA